MQANTRKWLVGCAIGCGSVMLVAVIAGVAFWAWLNRPGELLDAGRLLGADTTGYAEWTLRLEDPGTELFVTTLLESAQDASASGPTSLPPFVDTWLRDHRKREQQEDIRRLFPLVLGWTLRRGEDGSDLHLGTLSLERAGSRLVMVDWVLAHTLARSPGAEIHEHFDERIFRLPLEDDHRVTFFIRGNDVFFTSDVETAKDAVNRLRQDPDSARMPGAADRLLMSRQAGRPLRAVLTNEHGEILRQLEHVLSPDVAPPLSRELWGSLEGLALAAGLEQDGSLAGTLDLVGPDEAWARSHAGELARELKKFDPDQGHWVLESAADGNRVHVEFRVAELARIVGRSVRERLQQHTGSRKVRIEL